MKGLLKCLSYFLLRPLVPRSWRYSASFASSTYWPGVGGISPRPARTARAFSRSSIAILLLLLSITACASWALASPSGWWSPRYDSLFRLAAVEEWQDFPDWTWLKAQGVQESGLDPEATSPVGAAGIMQFMPATWSDIERQLGWRNVDPRSPQHAILGGAFYMRELRALWSGRGRSGDEQQALALPSYNAGAGNILAAQRLCHDARLWPDIAPCLPAVTGPANAQQTTDYPVKIAQWHAMMEGQ